MAMAIQENMAMTLEEMKNIDIRTVDPDTLVDIKGVQVNTSIPREDRILEFIEQIKNPYLFMCGKTVVKVSFADTDVTLEDQLERYLLSL